MKSGESEACPDWEFLVKGIRNEDGAAILKFCEWLKVLLRSLARRQLLREEDAHGCADQCLFLAMKGIQEGRLRDPEQTPKYVWGCSGTCYVKRPATGWQRGEGERISRPKLSQ